MDLGTKIKQIRTRLGLTQEELANRCELTKSFISQLENNKTSPSLDTLTLVLEVLGTNLSDFFHEEAPEKLVFNFDDQFVKSFEGYDITWLVSTSQKLAMEPIIMELKPYAKSLEDSPHEGQEFGYVMEGEITIVYGKNEFVCKKNESFYYEANKFHYLKNNTGNVARIIWVSCPPNF